MVIYGQGGRDLWTILEHLGLLSEPKKEKAVSVCDNDLNRISMPPTTSQCSDTDLNMGDVILSINKENWNWNLNQ